MKIRRKRQGRTAVGKIPRAKGPRVREAALAARVAELKAELQARDDFLAIAAHELRNPMTPISARLELLLARARVTTTMLPLAESAGCQVRISVEDRVSMLCDPTAVEQILENLLSNAIRFGPGRPVEVSLGSDGEAARLSVRDEGVGISDCDQALIFERFHRSRQAKPTGGFGIGLWVTRQLVRAMRGEIHVSSSPGAGSAFIVRLPLRPGGAKHAD